MSSTTLYRLSGISLLIGSVLTFIGTIPDTVSPDSISTFNVLGSVLSLIGIMLIVLGVPGMYARQAERAGILGLIGSILTVFFVLMAGYTGNILSAFVNPFLAAHSLLHAPSPIGIFIFFIVGSLLGLVGGTLLGIATIRAAILPRWAGMLLIAGGVLILVGNFFQPIGGISVLIFLAALAWLGMAVWSNPQTTVQAPLTTTEVRA